MKAILVVCALLLAATAASRDWAGHDDLHLGPMGVESCLPSVTPSGLGPVECEAEPLATIRGDVELLRWCVLVLSFVAAAGLVLATWVGARAPIVAVVFLAAVSIGVFEAVVLTEYEEFEVSRAFYLAVAAAIAAIVAIVVVAQSRAGVETSTSTPPGAVR